MNTVKKLLIVILGLLLLITFSVGVSAHGNQYIYYNAYPYQDIYSNPNAIYPLLNQPYPYYPYYGYPGYNNPGINLIIQIK